MAVLTNRIHETSVSELAVDRADTQLKLGTNRELPFIVKYKVKFEEEIKVGDMIGIFQKYNMDKRETWSTPKDYFRNQS